MFSTFVTWRSRPSPIVRRKRLQDHGVPIGSSRRQGELSIVRFEGYARPFIGDVKIAAGGARDHDDFGAAHDVVSSGSNRVWTREAVPQTIPPFARRILAVDPAGVGTGQECDYRCDVLRLAKALQRRELGEVIDRFLRLALQKQLGGRGPRGDR